MLATVEGNLIGTREVTGKDKKSYFIHQVVTQGRKGRVSLVEVFSQTNGRKNGPNKFVVNVMAALYKGAAQLKVAEVQE